jgi:hypothetical protein
MRPVKYVIADIAVGRHTATGYGRVSIGGVSIGELSGSVIG